MQEINTDVLEVAKIYIDRLLMPDDADGDALYLAIASYHDMDVLLTWNCNTWPTRTNLATSEK